MLFEKLFKSNSSEGYRDGRGIMFTSSEGRGGAPISKYVDAQPENIDALIAALSVSSTALAQERIHSLTDKLEYIAKAISMYNDMQSAGKQPFTIDIDEMNRYKSTPQNLEEKLIKGSEQNKSSDKNNNKNSKPFSGYKKGTILYTGAGKVRVTSDSTATCCQDGEATDTIPSLKNKK